MPRLVALGAVLLALLGVAVRPSSAAPPRTLATVQAGACTGRTVPAGYLGLSLEWSMVERWAGADLTTAERARLPLVQVLRTLATEAGQGGVLRVGGDSQDGYVWTGVGPRTANRLFQGVVDSDMVEAVLDVARLSGWKVVLGLNLRLRALPATGAMARHARSYDPETLLGVAPGNEPDAYHPDLGTYLLGFEAVVRGLAADPVTRDLPLYGPGLATGGDLHWLGALRAAHAPRLAALTWHHYANRPTLGTLFDEPVRREWAGRVREALGQAGPLPVRMEEGNSVGQGGLPGVSDVTGATPWLVDTLLSGAALGLAGYGLHTWDGADHPLEHRQAFYTPFVVRDGAASARPGYYALALLRDLPGSRLCGVRTLRAPGEAVRAWAYAPRGGARVSVVVTNPAGHGHAGRLAVALPADVSATRPVRVTRLHDPGGCGGRRADLSGSVLAADGTLAPRSTAVPVSGGRAVLDLAPCETVRLDAVRGG